MNRIDLAIPGVEPAFQVALRPCPLAGKEPSGKINFRALLAGKSRKPAIAGEPQAKAVSIEQRAAELLPKNGDGCQDEPLLFPSIDPEALPYSEDDCAAGELMLFPEEGCSAAAEAFQSAAASFSGSDHSLNAPPEGSLRQGAEPAGAGQTELAPFLTGETPLREGNPLEGDGLGEKDPAAGAAPDSSRIERQPQAAAEPDPSGAKSSSGDLDRSVKSDAAAGREGPTEHKGEGTAATPVAAASGLTEGQALPELFLTVQSPAGEAAAGKGTAGSALPGPANPTAEQVPGGVDLTGSMLEQLRGCCTYFRERAAFPAEIRLSLDPPELGELLIRVVSRQGKLSASIITGTVAVKEALAGVLHELHQRFEQNSLFLERVDLLTAGEMSLDDHRFKKGDYRGSWLDDDSAGMFSRKEEERPRVHRVGPVHEGAINYWA
ncbi:MAG: hypothetical protein GYA86_00345 [Firmicutes bacterium]|nr:hypothetical protein [Bacillota bacterium]